MYVFIYYMYALFLALFLVLCLAPFLVLFLFLFCQIRRLLCGGFFCSYLFLSEVSADPTADPPEPKTGSK